MAKISKKQVVSGPSFSSESLLAWIDSAAKENCWKFGADNYWGDNVFCHEEVSRLRAICTNRLVTIRLIKILKGVDDAERKAQSFLLEACRRAPSKFPSTIQRTPSEQARELSTIAKAARALAWRICCKKSEGIIESGTDHVDFVAKNLNNPKAIFPSEDAAYDTYYENLIGNDNDELVTNIGLSPKYLDILLASFGIILESQAKNISRRRRPPTTFLSRYIDSLAKICKAHLGEPDPTLVANIASVVTNGKSTLPMVRARIKKLVSRGFA